MRNTRRYLRNTLTFGSECIYHIENSVTGHVMSSAGLVRFGAEQSLHSSNCYSVPVRNYYFLAGGGRHYGGDWAGDKGA